METIDDLADVLAAGADCMTGGAADSHKLDLKVGDWVVVRSSEEIFATLDKNSRFEEIPFMPQMLRQCGRKYQVRKRAHKLCDTAFATGGRKLTDAVFLNDDRCDGKAHGGCELRCTIIWKEAWLRRATEGEQEIPSVALGKLESLVQAGTRATPRSGVSDPPIYICQATQLPAATTLLPWWKPGQYVEDYRSGNVGLRDIFTRLAFLLYAELAATGIGLGSVFRGAYNAVQTVRGGQSYPVRPGHLPVGGPTPAVELNLQEGELVRVKSGDEILATVDELLVNKGMGFHPEMMVHCGKTFRVSQRLQRLIDEKTGQMRELKNSCLVLEGTHCEGACTRPLSCPRDCPPYWREIWLERVGESPVPAEQLSQPFSCDRHDRAEHYMINQSN